MTSQNNVGLLFILQWQYIKYMHLVSTYNYRRSFYKVEIIKTLNDTCKVNRSLWIRIRKQWYNSAFLQYHLEENKKLFIEINNTVLFHTEKIKVDLLWSGTLDLKIHALQHIFICTKVLFTSNTLSLSCL